jgi:hypothetical protein
MAKNVNPIVDETAKADATVEAVVDTECHSPVIDNTSSKPEGEVEETKEVETSTEAAVADQVTETIEADKSTEIEVVKPEITESSEIGQSTETVENSTTGDEVTVTDTETSATDKSVTDLPEEKVDLNFQTEAETLMASQNVKEIWRCPVIGYWFTKAENALDHSKKVDKSPEHYKL